LMLSSNEQLWATAISAASVKLSAVAEVDALEQ
jgi:hypothetical protein